MSEAGNRPFMPSLQGQQFAPAEKVAAPVDTDKLAAAEMETFIGESRDVDPDASGEHKVVEPPPKPKKLPDGARSVDDDNERETPALMDADEDEDDAGDEDEDDAGDDDDAKDKDDKKPERRKLSVSERMRQLTRGRGEAERRAEATARENAELKARIEALERGEKPPVKTDDKAKGVDGRPDPSKFKYGEVDPEYLDAMIDWKTDQRLAKIEKDREEQTRAAELKEVTAELEGLRDAMAEKGVAEFGDDYMDVVIKGAIENKWPVSPIIADLTLRSEVGHKVAHHLATNPKEAREVYGKSPIAQAAYFGRLEAKFLTAKAAPAKQPSPPNAPTPPKHQARGGGGKFSVGADTDDFAAFEAKVRAENRG